ARTAHFHIEDIFLGLGEARPAIFLGPVRRKPALFRERLLPLDMGFLGDVAMLRTGMQPSHFRRVMLFDELANFLPESLVFLAECEIHSQSSVLGRYRPGK